MQNPNKSSETARKSKSSNLSHFIINSIEGGINCVNYRICHREKKKKIYRVLQKHHTIWNNNKLVPEKWKRKVNNSIPSQSLPFNSSIMHYTHSEILLQFMFCFYLNTWKVGEMSMSKSMSMTNLDTYKQRAIVFFNFVSTKKVMTNENQYWYFVYMQILK